MAETPIDLTPQEFEEEVERLLRQLGVGLFALETRRLERIDGSDGSYEIDVTARFEALGANFLVLIECKHHKNPIKREVVQILYDRIRAVGGQKGMIFSTSSFQRGAIEFAKAHGIALVQITDGQAAFATRSTEERALRPSWAQKYAGWIVGLNNTGDQALRLIFERNPQILLERFSENLTAERDLESLNR
jgi:restriction system protein